ncbi:3-deoxy-manno-octulosonate cytidylyltransferase [candidate division KSB1 bacterium]
MNGNSHNGILGVIPARYGSTRFPGKPLASICSKPMIQHVYERASGSKVIDKLIVATDNEEIFDCVKSFGGDVIMTDSSIPTGTDRAAEAARKYPYDIILNIQGDEPLLEGEMLDSLAKPLIEDETVYSSTLVKRITEERELTDPNLVRVILDKDGYALYFSRSIIPYYNYSDNKDEWINNHTYYRHIGLYGYRLDFLFTFIELKESSLEKAERLEQLRVLENGYRMKAGIVDYTPYPVDVPDDIPIVEEMINKRISTK